MQTEIVSSSTYWQTMVALVAILVLLFGIALLVRKFAFNKNFGQSKLKIKGGITLGPRERIFLIEIEDTELVIGIIPGQIRTLHKSIKKIDDSPETNDKNFSQWLKSSLNKNKNDATPDS